MAKKIDFKRKKEDKTDFELGDLHKNSKAKRDLKEE